MGKCSDDCPVPIVPPQSNGFTIEVRSSHWASRDWSSDVGCPNEFGSEEEAEKAIEGLKGLGEEWASAEYRVVEYN